MVAGKVKPVLSYRDAADDRTDAAEAEGRVVGRIAVAALWGFIGIGALLLPTTLVVWALLVMTAPL